MHLLDHHLPQQQDEENESVHTLLVVYRSGTSAAPGTWYNSEFCIMMRVLVLYEQYRYYLVHVPGPCCVIRLTAHNPLVTRSCTVLVQYRYDYCMYCAWYCYTERVRCSIGTVLVRRTARARR